MYKLTSMSRAISLKEIPQNLVDGMTLLNKNKGNTALVFDKGDGNVRIFTRDEMKKDYLVWGLGSGEMVEIIDTPNSRFQKDIHVIDMPKLYKVSGENSKIVNLIVKVMNNTWSSYINKVARREYRPKGEWLEEMMEELEKGNTKLHQEAYEIIESFYNHIINYDENQWGMDIAKRNFMQTKDGELVLLDPVADKELTDILFKRI